MKAFGLELKRSRTIQDLYGQADLILKSVTQPDRSVTHDMKRETIAHAIHKMIGVSEWFDVCVIRSCSEIANIHIPSERLEIYRVVHCIHWNKMEPDYRKALVAMVLDDFRPILNPEVEVRTIQIK